MARFNLLGANFSRVLTGLANSYRLFLYCIDFVTSLKELSFFPMSFFPSRFSYLKVILVLTAGLSLSACGPSGDPLTPLKQELAKEKEYSIILNDMREEGNFVPSYFHQYRVDIGEKTTQRQPVEVTEAFYRKNEPYLGMALATRTPDGKETQSPIPNGYQYVGNPQYGQWRTNESGGSFWEFYGKYMLISQAMRWAGFGLGRNHYDAYSSGLASNRPYFGPNRQYGTSGSITKKQKPDFFARKAARKARASSRFQDRVKQRTGRSKNTFRSRGYSFGK